MPARPLLPLLAAVLLAAGCQARALVPSEADGYRDEIRSLKGQIDELKRANTELRTQLAAAQPVAPSGESADEVRANVPMPIQIKVGWGTAIEVARDEAGAPDPAKGVLRLYLEPLDARGRFVQVSGYLEVACYTMPPSPAQPLTVGGVRLRPGELRDLYRSGLTGAHYTIPVPIDLAAAKGSETVLVQVTYRDGLSGETLRASTVVALTR